MTDPHADAAERALTLVTAALEENDDLLAHLISTDPDPLLTLVAVTGHAADLLRKVALEVGMEPGDYWRVICERYVT